MIRRQIFTASPPRGDYILGSTGVSWNVDRTNGDGTVMRISAGERNKKSALAALLSLAEGDKTDAWEPVGTNSYRLIKRHRAVSFPDHQDGADSRDKPQDSFPPRPPRGGGGSGNHHKQ